MNDKRQKRMVYIFAIIDIAAGLAIITAAGIAVGVWLLPFVGIEHVGIRIALSIITTILLFWKAYQPIVLIWHHTLGTVLVFTLGLGIIIITDMLSAKDE